MKQKNIRFIFNGILFIAISLFQTQLLPFLKKIGYNATQRNMIMACNALFSIVFQVLFGYLCDRYKSMKKFFILSYALLLGFGIWMFSIHKNHLLLHIISSSMMAAMIKVCSALIETWMLYLNKKEFGKYRSIGAIGLCIGSPIAGMIVDAFSFAGLMYSGIGVSVLLFLLAFFCDEVQYEEKLQTQEVRLLLKNKPYMYMTLIYILIYIVGSADQFVVVDKMLHLKANSFLIGVKWALQSLCEIPFFLYAEKILKKYSPYRLLGIAIIMYGIKFMLYGFSDSSIGIIITTTLQIVTLPIVAYTSKIIFAQLSPHLKASSQMIAMAVFIGGSAFFTPFITAFLLPRIGYDFTLYAFALFSLCPFTLLVFKNRILQD